MHSQSAMQWICIMALSVAFFLPFRYWYGAAYTRLEIWKGSRTSLSDYLIIHGVFVFLLLLALLLELRFGRGLNGAARLVRALLVRVFEPRRLSRFGGLLRRSVRLRGVVWLLLVVLALVVLGGVTLLAVGHALPGFLVLCLALVGLVKEPRLGAGFDFISPCLCPCPVLYLR